jgi:hypothetical protein
MELGATWSALRMAAQHISLPSRGGINERAHPTIPTWSRWIRMQARRRCCRSSANFLGHRRLLRSGSRTASARSILQNSGFFQLFRASWIWKAPARPRANTLPVRWTVLQEPSELAKWEATWWRRTTPGDTTPKPRLFPAALLHASDVAFVAGFVDDKLVAGCVLASSDDVVGLSCSFYETVDPIVTESDLLSEIHRLHPDRPIVSYESGERLRAARLCGFEPVGALRVWLRNTPRVEA